MPAREDQNVSIEEFFDSLKSYLDEKQIAFVKKAYDQKLLVMVNYMEEETPHPSRKRPVC